MSYNLKRLLQYSSLEITKEFIKVFNPSKSQKGGTFESYSISGFLAHFVYVFSKGQGFIEDDNRGVS